MTTDNSELPASFFTFVICYHGHMSFEFTGAQIEELRVICEKELDCSFSTMEARIMANHLFDFYECLLEISRQPDLPPELVQMLQDQSEPSDL